MTRLPREFTAPDTPDAPARIVHGVPAWWASAGGDVDYGELYVHTRDRRRALAVTNAMIRATGGAAGMRRPEIRDAGWCLLATECGCTQDQHAGHDGCEDAGCAHPELPPCNADPVYSWVIDKVGPRATGAMPYMRIVLTVGATIYDQAWAAVRAGQLMSAPACGVCQDTGGATCHCRPSWFEPGPPVHQR